MRAPWLAKIVNRAIGRRMTRPPDFVIGGAERPYMLRWYLLPRNRFFNVYHHAILRSDDDRALHDHPWWSVSLVLDGAMLEVLPPAAHRLEIRDHALCRTLFITGPKVREWGFHCPKGWRHWRDFVSKGDSGSIGPGCGE